MEKFEKLLAISDRLLGPKGCPWDREQTLTSLQPYLLEEAHELIEAIDLMDPVKIAEELGDVFYVLLFISQVGKKEQLFTLDGALETVAEKLIRRHPHVFGKEKVESGEEVARVWEEVKKKEGKKNAIDGIPPGLPSLARAQKVISKLKKGDKKLVEQNLESEGDLGQRLWALVREAEDQGIDAESALRRTCQMYEEKHRR